MRRSGLLRRAALAAVLAAGLAPVPAHAQAPQRIDGSPLDVYADRLGGLQVIFDGQRDGEFHDPQALSAAAGLELRWDGGFSPPSDPARTPIGEPELTTPDAATQVLTTRYAAGPLEVTERVVVREGLERVRLEYVVANAGTEPLDLRAAEIGQVHGEAGGATRGVLRDGFVGTRDRRGREVGLARITPWQHHGVDEAAALRERFRTGPGLDDGVTAGFLASAVGAEWRFAAVAPDATREFAVEWTFDPHETLAAVTTTLDGDDGACDSVHCTLREAVRYASKGSVIDLPAGTFLLTGGQLNAVHDLTLAGRGARETVIDGANASRLLEVVAGRVEAHRIAFRRGFAPPNDARGFAFAFAPSGLGGAIYVSSGASLALDEVAVTDSAATFSGGGIASHGELTLNRSLVARNKANAGGGGGILAQRGAGPSLLDLQNSTVSDNQATGSGGGINAAADLYLRHATIAGNTGGGIAFLDGGAADVQLAAVAGNTPAACSGKPAASTGARNLFDDGSCDLPGTGGADARLAPLAGNGGPTDTRALLPGSPAIDAGEPGLCLPVDQRGLSRDQGRTCDIGAYEVPASSLEPIGWIAGRPLDVAADGVGRLQLRRNGAVYGPFESDGGDAANAGLAIFHGGTYYPAAGPGSYGGPIGRRIPISGPTLSAPAPGVRRLRSVYHVGPDLEVTEDVAYTDGERGVALKYAIRNASAEPVSFRAGQLAELRQGAAPVRGPGTLGARTSGGALVELVQATPWHAAQLGRHDHSSSVYEAFTSPEGLSGSDGESENRALGADWNIVDLAGGATAVIEVGWRIEAAPAAIRVSTTEDEDDDCTPGSCSLREAVRVSGFDEPIELPAGVYQLTRGSLWVAGEQEIRGAGARTTVIRGADGRRVLDVAGALGLSGVTVTGGRPAPNPDDGGEGGGIRVHQSGALNLSDSAVAGNWAVAGGGIYAQGPTAVARSLIAGNHAVHVTVDEHETGGTGGGVYAEGLGLSIVNSTVTGNSATIAGGGLAVHGPSRVDGVTVTDNAAPAGSGLLFHIIEREWPELRGLDVRGSVLAGNRGGAECAGEGRLTSSHSLASDAACGLDAVVADARLGALADNGGPTDTHALLAGSPALDAGGALCPTGDQRGMLRAAGAACDAGAYELTGAPAPPAPAITAPADGAWSRSPNVAVTGSAAAGTTVTVLVGGTPRGQTTAAAGGAWTVALTGLADGAHVLTATASNANGTSPASAPRTVRVDTQPPAAPTLRYAYGAGTITFSGAAEPGAVVTVYDGAQALGSATAGAGGAWSLVLPAAADAAHAFFAEARDAAGNVSTRSAVVVVPGVPPPPDPTPTPTPTPGPALPPPVAARSVNVQPAGGTVLIQLPGSKRFVALRAGEQVRVGAVIDTRKGRVTLTSAAGGGATQTADFFGGVFKVGQTGGAKPVTELTLVEALSCPQGRAKTAAAKPKVRRLWGDGKGRFRTKGRYSAATVRGTVWLVEDRCDSTLTRVRQGSVEVRDQVRKRTVVVKAGRRHVVRAKRR